MSTPSEEVNQGLLSALARRGRAVRDRALRVPAVGRSVKAAMLVATGLRTDPITLRAAALTYLTMLSIVPLLAVVFSVVQAIVGRAELVNDLEHFILENLAVGARENIAPWISKYVRNASTTAIGGVGFALLLFSAVSLMANVEKAFNHTFLAPRPRPLGLRFGIYWCLLTLGPILLALSITATAILQSSGALEWLGPARRVLLLIAPFLVTWSAFSLLYFVVPATRVKGRAALIGALVSGTAWEIAKIAYTSFSASSVRQNAIYGSLSAIPIFLVWVYLSWIIVLFGARVAWAVQTPGAGLGAAAQSGTGREMLFARIVLSVAEAFHAGHPPMKTRQVALSALSDESTVVPALVQLERDGLVREVKGGGWVPGRALSRLSLEDVRASARGNGWKRVEEGGYQLLGAHLSQAELAAARELQVSFESLVLAGSQSLSSGLSPLETEEEDT